MFGCHIGGIKTGVSSVDASAGGTACSYIFHVFFRAQHILLKIPILRDQECKNFIHFQLYSFALSIHVHVGPNASLSSEVHGPPVSLLASRC